MRFKSIIWLIVLVFSITELNGIETRPKMRRACLNRLDSTIDLLWFKPLDNCNSFTSFSVYGRDDILGLFNLLGTYNTFTTTNLSIKLPNLKDWEFYMVYNKSCNGIDSVYSDTIAIDNTAPIDSDLDSVSVDLATQKTQIGWSVNPSPDVKGYLVYHITGINKVINNTIATSYLDLSEGNPAVGPVSYGVAAYDSCNNTSLISTPHRTVFIQTAYDQCNKTINLSWSNYIGWTVSSYQIFRKINNGNYQLVGSVISNINQFTYNFSTFGDTYCFFIRALKQGSSISSSSNQVCVSTGSIIASNNSYIAKASVQNEGIDITLLTQTGTSLQQINIYKGDGNSAFTLWQSVANTGGLLELRDNSVNVHNRSYKYYFTTEGPCKLIFDTSQIAKTILLRVAMNAPGDQNLDWSLYSDFIKLTQKQEILLSDNEGFDRSSPWNIVSSIGNSSFTASDQTNFDTQQEQICYCIRAIENDPTIPYNRRDTSYSNIECVTADPIVFFPNAIQINGFNTSFYPKGFFIDYEKSFFQIYNRWGEIVYETNDIRKAWYGTYNDSFVDSDVYAYKATIVGKNGKVLYFDGTITVLK